MIGSDSGSGNDDITKVGVGSIVVVVSWLLRIGIIFSCSSTTTTSSIMMVSASSLLLLLWSVLLYESGGSESE